MKLKRRILKGPVVAAATAGLVSVGAPTLAQQQQRAAAIEEVVVTARKKEESLQDVPVAVSAFDQRFVDNSFADQIQDFAKYTPNVNLSQQQFGGGALNASIRGVSYDEVEKTFEPSVGVSVDGVFFSGNSGAMVDMFDIQSIEILRGPQGTLYGRNTMGGTINIQRTKPSQEFGMKTAFGLGSYDRRDVKFRITGPLIEDKLAGKFGFYSFEGDSHTRNFTTGERDRGVDRVSFLGSLLWTPTENLDVQFSLDYLDDDSHFPKVLNMTLPGEPFCDAFGACASGSFDVARAEGFDVSFGSEPFKSKIETTTASVNLNWHVSDYTVTSITAVNRMEELLSEENTGSPDIFGAPVFFVIRDQELDQFSQELRLTSEYAGPLNFVAGLFYFKSDYELDPQRVRLLGDVVGLVNVFKAEQKLDAAAVFGELYYDITSRLRLTLGGRYTYEEKELDINLSVPASGAFRCPDPAAPNKACRDPKVDFDDFSPRVGLDYHFTDEVMGYLMWSRGFRSGGWNGRAQTQTSIGPYDPEQLDNYELGVRSDLFDRRVRLNATVFHMEYDDKQEAIIRPSPISAATETTVSNAASATVDGVELEVQAAVTPNLQLRSAIGWLDAGFDEFKELGQDIKSERNYSYAPEWTASVGAEYYYPLDRIGGELVFGANYKWTDDFATDPIKDPQDPPGVNRAVIDNYGEFDTSVTYQRPMGGTQQIRISAFVHDAFHSDGRIFRVTNAGPWVFGDQEPGRTWGLEFTYEM